MASWISRIIKGMIIALGFILPGVSGGVLACNPRDLRTINRLFSKYSKRFQRKLSLLCSCRDRWNLGNCPLLFPC